MYRLGLLLPIVVLSATPLLNAHDRTPWGDPDIQGVWSNQTPTPLERPDALAGKATLSDEEARQFEQTALERLLTTFAREVPLSGELNEIWLETAKGRVPPGRSTSLIVDPPDGKIPFTVEGRKRWDAQPKIGKPLLANVPEDRNLAERCITTEGLQIPNPFYNNYFEIVQAPGYVVIVTEMMHEVRVIPLDRSPHVGSAVRMWSGDSRGWWEGQTLVVETTNFTDRKGFRGGSGELHFLERFTKLDDDTIDYQLTVTDPVSYTQPWTLRNGLWRADGGMYEVACHEGNIGLRGILAGARVQEAN
jgi:hypothetical protein